MVTARAMATARACPKPTRRSSGLNVALVDAAENGDVTDAELVLPHAQSTTIATRALKRMRGNIAARSRVFAYSPPWPVS